MIQFENGIVIHQGRDRIFSYISNVQKATEWNYAVIRVEVIQTKKEIIGSEYFLIRKFGNRETRDHIVVTQYRPGKHFAIESIAGGPFPYVLEYLFSVQGQATVVTNKTLIQSKGFSGLITSLAVSRIKKEVYNNLCVMKKITESL